MPTAKKTTKAAVSKPKAEKKTTTKKTAVVKVSPEEVKEAIEATTTVRATKKTDYLYAVGRRKTAVAQVRLYKKGNGKITINAKDMIVAFPTLEQQEKVLSPLRVVGQMGKLDVTVKVSGGGQASQSEAVRHGLSRALVELNQNFRKPLKKSEFLTRDARRKERKKPGLKRARKAPQFSKR